MIKGVTSSVALKLWSTLFWKISKQAVYTEIKKTLCQVTADDFIFNNKSVTVWMDS